MSDPKEIKTINYSYPLGKSNHMVPNFEVEKGMTPEYDEWYRLKRYNYSKTNFNGLRTFLENVDWSGMYEVATIQEKYEMLINVYEEGVRKCSDKHQKQQLRK